jgi:hypothetical protein
MRTDQYLTSFEIRILFKWPPIAGCWFNTGCTEQLLAMEERSILLERKQNKLVKWVFVFRVSVRLHFEAVLND